MRRCKSLSAATLCALLLVGLSVASCKPSSDRTVSKPRERASLALTSPSTARLETLDEAEELLLDSFVVNGGYFVDDAWSARRSPFSLYETWWQLQWRDGAVPPEVKRDRIEPWLRVGAVGELSSTSMQQIAQIDLATKIARVLRLHLDSTSVAAKVEALKNGHLYSPDPAVEGDWGSTAAAVRALEAVGAPVPEDTLDAAAAELAKRKSMSPQDVISTVIPVLELVTLNPGSIPPSEAERVTARASEILDSIPTKSVDLSWLGAKYQLESIRVALGRSPRPLDAERCANLLKGGVVTVPGHSGADLQGTFYARELGCRGVVTSLERPYTRAGWVSGRAVEPYETLGATAAALQVAKLVGVSRQYARAMTDSTMRLWESLPRDKSLSGGARKIAIARLAQVKVTVGPPLHPSELAIGSADQSSGPLVDMLLAMTRGDAEARRVATAILTAAESAEMPGSIDVAAGIFLAGTYADDQEALAKADDLVRKLRISPTVFAGECTPAPSDCSELRPSVAASAIGSWITKQQGSPRQSWERLGLCRGYICSDEGQDGASFGQVYIALACDMPACGDRFPLLL